MSFDKAASYGSFILAVLCAVPVALNLFGVETFGALTPYLKLGTALSPFAMLFAGVLFGWSARGIRDKARRDKEVDPARDAELRAMAVRIDKLPLVEKVEVAQAYDGIDIKMPGRTADGFFVHSMPALEGIAYAVQHEMGVITLRLEAGARDAIDAHPECLDSAREVLRE